MSLRLSLICWIGGLMGGRNYTEATKKALFALSLGRCYEPSCPEQVVRMAGETAIVVVEIAHISAASPKGPRWRSSMTAAERQGFSNLILLCSFHHKLIDRKPSGDSYKVATLKEWKEEREKGFGDKLTHLTEETLRDVLSENLESVILETRSTLLAAIERVRIVAKDSGEMLKTLVESTLGGPRLDPDAVARLTESARVFQNTLPDYVPILRESSQNLSGLPDHAWMLLEASRNLRSLPDSASQLYQASQNLTSISDDSVRLRGAAQKIESQLSSTNGVLSRVERLNDQLSDLSQVEGRAEILSGVSKSIEDQTMRLAYTIADAEAVRIPDRFTYLRNGFICGFVVGLVALGLLWYLVAGR